MSKYGNVVYGGAKYGATPKLTLSVEPMSIQVIKFKEAYVFWQLPTGSFTRFRLVRNQFGYPETAEDGIIIFEQISPDGSSLDGVISKSFFLDGEENPDQIQIVTGRNIFYRVFLYTSENVWVVAGSAKEVVPNDSKATTSIMDLLPRVYTSSVLSPLGVIDTASDLYNFLDGFAFTYEQLMTQIALLRPLGYVDKSNYTTIPGEVLNLGLTPEPNLAVINQRRLIREAIYLYSTKGTLLGLSNYIESLTGYSPTISISNNLLLTVQDSTFYKGIGNWSVTNNRAGSCTSNKPN